MPNPLVGRGINRSRKQDAERPTPITPVPEDYAGENIPYRGTNQHGVTVTEHWRDPETDMPLPPDGRLVPVYEHEEKAHDPIPVYIVNSSSRERRAFRTIIAYAGGNGIAKQILTRDENRTRATIRNPEWAPAPMYIAHSPELAGSVSGFPILAGQTYQTEAQTSIYATTYDANDLQVQIAVEYRVSLDG